VELEDIIKYLTAVWLVIQIIAKLKEIFTKTKPPKDKRKNKRGKK